MKNTAHDIDKEDNTYGTYTHTNHINQKETRNKKTMNGDSKSIHSDTEKAKKKAFSSKCIPIQPNNL